MRGTRHAPVAALVTCLAVTGAVVAVSLPPPALAAPAASAAKGICTSATHPRLAARISRGIIAALRGRDSVAGVAAADARYGLTCNFHASWHFDAASVIKATIISALLLKSGGPSRLTSHQRHLAWLMITQSDNSAAQALWDEVGISHMQAFLNRAGMQHTVLHDAWGLSQLTAHDELTLLRLLTNPGTVLTTTSRRYVLWLMAHVVSYERWGVPAGAPSAVTVHVKNGWLPYPDAGHWHINSIGAFTGTNILYQIAVLTSGNPSESYGIQTVQRVAVVINDQLAWERGVEPSAPEPLGKAALTAPGG
jgi:hypothetical protein